MIAGFAALLACQLVGEALVRGLGLPLPGPVVGLVLLVIGVAVTVGFGGDRAADPTDHDRPLGRVADGLLGSLGLMFVPAGVGVVQYLGLIGEHIGAIGTALVLSTALTLLATVGTFLAIRRLIGETEEEG